MSIFDSGLDLTSRSINLKRIEDFKKEANSNNALHPLAIPTWSEQKSKSFKIKSQVDFDFLLEKLETELGNSLQDLRYDIVENVLQFYRFYKRERNDSFLDIYKRYEAKLPPQNHDCIGLVLELKKSFKKLEAKFPNIFKYFFVASCQENLKKIPKYTEFLSKVFEFEKYDSDCQKLMNFDKEHVVLCFKFELEFSGRSGTIIFDPGFHVGKVVVAMEDGSFPHTGWFVQKQDMNFKKLYEYSYSEGTTDFINWNEKTHKNGAEINVINVIYTGRPYVSYVEVTEKRNLVYFFKSLLSRDRKGNVVAGIYFKIELEREEFTVLYQNDGKQRVKINFEDLKDDKTKIDKMILIYLTRCSDQIKMADNELLDVLLNVKEMVSDKVFVRGLLDIEEYITEEVSGIWSLEDPEHVYCP